MSNATKWTLPIRQRRSRQEAHPVHDFLFTYYSHSLAKFEEWHPPIGLKLEMGPPDSYRPFENSPYYSCSTHSFWLDPAYISEKLKRSFGHIKSILETTQNRPAYFGCYGLHEWAMVYKAQDVRHKNSTPFRLSQQEIDAIVESRPIVCSHFDAFRFFPENAKPFNKLQPSGKKRNHFEQAGCIHANMDLYKWSYKCLPWIGSDFVYQCFELALDAREIDMRASPYDLTKYGYEAILIETSEGRQQYEAEQRRLAESGKKLRQELISFLKENQNHL